MTRDEGMRTFFVVWAGQVVSVVGSGLTSFALGIWTLQETGSVTPFAMVTLSITLPAILMTPIAGPLVDRWDRRVTMLVADLVAGLATAGVALLFFSSNLELWHVYLNAVVISISSSFQEPSYVAALPTLVPKERLSNANGMVQLGQALGTLLSPAIAGLLLVSGGLGVVMLVDFATFLLAVVTLTAVRFPRVAAAGDQVGLKGLLAEALEGWRYLRAKPGMQALLYIFAGVNFLLGIVMVLYIPMVLAFTTEQVLGFAVSAAGVGMLGGSVLMSSWSGPARKIDGLLWPIAAGGLAIVVIGLAPSVWPVVGGAFVLMFVVPIANTSSQVLWQTKIPLELQGRIFSVRRVFAQSATPISYLLAGPLADRLFEPWLAEGGALADSVGRLLGTGQGRGIGFMFVVLGLATTLLSLTGFLYEPVRNLDDNLPDVAAPLGVAGEPA
jgi:MFS family permease